jgi:hypothetical protein
MEQTFYLLQLHSSSQLGQDPTFSTPSSIIYNPKLREHGCRIDLRLSSGGLPRKSRCANNPTKRSIQKDPYTNAPDILQAKYSEIGQL